MKVMTITRNSHPASFKKSKSLGQLIALVEKEGERDQLFITKIFLNGSKMDAEEESLLDGLSIDEVETLEVEMETIGEIIKGALATQIAAIQDVQVNSIRFAKDFRRLNAVDDEKVKHILIACRSVIEGLEEIFASHVKGKFTIKHVPLWREAEKELTNIIQCILQARKIGDVTFVSDLIEYDLVQALDQWEEAIEREIIENPVFGGIFSLKSIHHRGDNEVDV